MKIGGDAGDIPMAIENAPVTSSPVPTVRIVPIAAKRVIKIDPMKIPVDETNSSREYV